jgi:cysteine desulfurase
VVRVTGNFSSEAPLPGIVASAISAAFEAGWADPKKLSQAATRSKILRSQAIESIAGRLGTRVDEIEIVGEGELATYLCIAGFLKPDRHLAVGAIDRGKIRAFTRTHHDHTIVPVDSSGALLAENIPAQSLLTLQMANGETGVIQDVENLAGRADLVVLDATASAPRVSLPSKWDGAIFSSESWGGPTGLAFMAIRSAAQWRYPLPHIAPIRTPGGYSLPLLLGAAVALENFNENKAKVGELNLYLRKAISQSLPDAQVVGNSEKSLPHKVTVIIPGGISEMFIRELEAQSITIDAGSACSPDDLTPSHVLASMGLPTEGSIRLTLRDDHTEAEIDDLVNALVKVRSDL